MLGALEVRVYSIYLILNSELFGVLFTYFVSVTTMDSSRDGQHKVARCRVCCKTMRSDNLKRHQKTHEGLQSLNDEEVLQELRSRQESFIRREERQQEIRELARIEGIPVERCSEIDMTDSSLQPVDIVQLESQLLTETKTYDAKVDLGKNIVTILNKGIAREDALSKENKEALDLYKKQIPRMDIHTVVLREWQ